ncbi:MAG: tripartite tricarboxylate transporter substrate binding protein [Gammaproteobacteria bacterium]|nr:tripartite tricarboxylate transporter substrate binding protein [Gammaproteobacteria bacterium]
MNRLRTLIPALLAITMIGAAPASQAQAFPERPIKLVVGFPPGGGVDIVARQLAETLSGQLGQPVIVDNKAGAAGNLAMDYVAHAPADGYTLLMGNLGMLAANPVLYPKLGFDVSKDLAPVARLVVTPLLAAVPSSTPVKTMQELIAVAKQKPGQLNFGSGGNGNINHLAGELLKMQTGTQIVHVPYKGSAPALAALMAGEVQLVIDGFNVVQPSVAGGRARAIALTGDKRSPAMPDVPTMKEAGLPELVIYGWQGVFAPTGTPQPVVDRLSAEIAKALATPALNARLTGQGTEPAYQSPAQFKTYIGEEQARWAKVIKTAKITIE